MFAEAKNLRADVAFGVEQAVVQALMKPVRTADMLQGQFDLSFEHGHGGWVPRVIARSGGEGSCAFFEWRMSSFAGRGFVGCGLVVGHGVLGVLGSVLFGCVCGLLG